LWLSRGSCATMYSRMTALRLVCFASLLAAALVAGTADGGGSAGVQGVPEPPTGGELHAGVGDENRQESQGIRITMTGREQEEEGEVEGDATTASVGLRARTGP